MSEMTAVVDEPPAETAQVLAERVAALDAELELLREEYYELHARRQTGEMGREDYVTYMMVEDRLKVLTQIVEGLRPELEQAYRRDGAYQAKARHDAGIPRSRAKAEEVLTLVAALARTLAELVDAFDDQIEELVIPRNRTGLQALELPSGHEQAVLLLGDVWPGDFRAKHLVEVLVHTPPTVGNTRQAMESCSRLKPFSTTTIESYLASFEGVSHANL